MAGVQFDIAIEANGLGVDATADSLNALADRITLTNTVATEFDAAVAALRTRLSDAASVTKAAAAALSTAEARYRELESAANKAAKEVEKAALAGKDTKALAEAADTAKVAMMAQVKTVDDLRAKSVAAAAAQGKLAASLKTLEGQQAAATSKIKSAQGAASGTSQALDALGANEKIGKLQKLAAGFKSLHGATMLVGLGVLGLTVAAVAGLRSVAKLTGFKFDGFNKALGDVKSLFNEGTSSANGLKKIVETVFGPLDDAVGKSGPLVKEMFKGLIFGALQVVIAVLKLRNEIFKAMSPETRAQIKSVMDQVLTLENAFKLGTAGAIVLVAIFAVLTIALIGLAVAELAALWPILLVIAAVAAVIAIFMYWGEIVAWLSGVWTGIVNFIKRIPEAWLAAAKAMIDGIINGIKNGATAVYQALKDLALGGLKSFKGALGIKSPSTVFAVQGKFIADGVVEGLEDSEAEVNAALTGMVEPSAATPGAAPGGKGAAAGGGRVVHIEHLTIGDSPVAAKSWEDFKAMLTSAIEGATITIGGGEAPAT